MKSILTNLKVHLLALFAAAFCSSGAWAVPVQIWNGDFTVNEDGTTCTKVVGGITYTLTLNGNAVREEDGKKYIEITNSNAGSLGVSVVRSANTGNNGGAVVVKYSNLVSTGYEPNVILASLYENTKMDSGYPQIAGLQLSNAQGTPSIFWAEGYWNNKEKNGGDGTALTMGESAEGYFAFSYSTGGSIAYRGTAEGEWTKIFVQSGSVGSDTYGIKGVGVGGLYMELGRAGAFKNSARPATGMKIHAIAFADAGVTEASEMGGFEFTEYAAKINGQGYATVAEAIAAAQETDEIEILRNSDEALTLSRNVILTVAEGKSFTLSGAISGDYNVTKKGLGTLAIKHNVAAANILDIAEGTLKYQPAASNGFKGTLNVHHGATYVNVLSQDVWAWNYSGVKVNIHGTFDMGSTRANVNSGQTWKIYGGATITCASNNTRCFDFADQGNPTFNFLAHTEGDSDVITFDVQGSYRTKDPTFNIAEGVTVVVTKTQDLWSDTHTLTKSGNGTLKFATTGKVNSASIALNVTGGHLDLTELGGTAAENIKGNLTLANGVTLHLPETLEEGVAYPLCAGTLTPPTTVQDVTVYVGDMPKTVNLTFDTTAKTVSYDIYRETLQSWSAGTIIFDGDLHLLVKNADGTYTKTIDGVTYTINLNGHELVKEGSHSYILIKEDANADQLGVTVSRAATSETGLTMVMKYSDYGYVDAAKSIPFTISCSSYDNVVAPFIDSEDGVMKTYWANFHQGTEYASTAASKFDSSIDTGYLALSYGSSGTRVFQKGEDAWTEVYKNGDVKGTGTYNIKGVSVGGLFSKKTGNAAVIADGMKIYSLAVTTTPVYDNNSEDLTKLAFAGDDLVYNAFLTTTAVDTGWIVASLDDLLGYTFYGTMDGANISGNNVDSRGFHVAKDGESVVFQMQVRQNQGSNNDHVKAVKVRLTLDANKHVLIEGAGAGHVSNQYLGTNITSWGDTFVSDANTAGYGVNKVVATKKPVPFASVGFDGDTWTSSAITDDHASGRVNSNFMNENGTDAASNFVSVRESSTDKAVKIADNVRPSYKNEPNLTFSKAVKGNASWTVQAVAKMVPQDGKRLAVWGIGETSYQGSGDRGVVLLLNTDGRPQFCKYGNKTTTDIIAATDGDSLYDDRYHVYTIVCNKNTVSDRYSLYVDGELVASSGSAALATIPTSSQYFEVGTVRGGAEQLPTTNKSIGSFFDDIAAWNVALTAAEVKANAKKFPVWPIYIAREWQGADGETITTPANWGAAEAFDFGKTTGVFPDATKSVTLVGETKFGTIEINGAYTFRGTGTIATSTLDFGANGSLRLEAGTTLKFTGSFDKALLSKITFAGGKVAFKNVPSFTQSDNINVDTNLEVGSYKMLEWTDFAAVGAFGYGLPMLNNSALNPTATVTNHGTATVQEVEFTNGKARLLGLVGGVYLEIRDEARRNRTALKILPLGDSITEGYNSSANCANYRTQLAAKLSMDGYNVRMLGYHYVRSRMPSGEWAPLEWQMHAGVSAQRVWTRTISGNSNARAGDMEAVEATLNMVGGEPDVVLFKLGTNDIGVGDTAEHIFLGFTNTIKYLHEKLPNASIITTTCVKYGRNDSVRQSYNTMIRNWFANGEAPEGVYLVDQCKNVGDGSEAGSFNDAQGRPLFYSDSTHPDWAGHDLMSDGWLNKIEELYNTDARKKSGDYVEVVPETYELGAEHNVQSSYLEGFTHMRTLEVQDVACYPQTAFDSYDWKNTTDVFSSIEKVGYYVELVRRDTGAHKFVWVDMDAFGSTLDEVGLPTTATKQQKVTSLHVYSNMDSVHNVAANDDTVNGYIEFSPYNSTAAARSGDGVPSQLWSAMDWNDTFATSGAGRGAMQVHRVKKDGDELWNAAEVVFAYNNWGSANNGATGTDAGEIGIGNFAQHYMGDTSYGNANGHEINALYGNGTINIDDNNCSVDYTSTRFSPVGDMVNAKAYSIKNIEIWVKGTVQEVAQIGSDIYPTLEAALEAASGATVEQPVTITLLKSCAETGLVIPANVTIKTTNTNQFTGTATGSGRIVFEGYLPTGDTMTAFQNAANWTGTVELKDIGVDQIADGNKIILFGKYANANASVALNDVTSTMFSGNNNYPDSAFVFKSLEIMEGGWTSTNGTLSFSNSPLYQCNLIGSGTITVDQPGGGAHAVNFVGDHSGFTGSIVMGANTTKGVVLSPAESDRMSTNIAAKKIVIVSNQPIAEGETEYEVTIAEGANWEAAGGVEVRGTLKGAGNVTGNITFADGATIDASQGAVKASGAATFVNTLNIVTATTDLSGLPVLGATSVSGCPTILINGESSTYVLEKEGDTLVMMPSELTSSDLNLDADALVVAGNITLVVDEVIQSGAAIQSAGGPVTVTLMPGEGKTYVSAADIANLTLGANVKLSYDWMPEGGVISLNFNPGAGNNAGAMPDNLQLVETMAGKIQNKSWNNMTDGVSATARSFAKIYKQTLESEDKTEELLGMTATYTGRAYYSSSDTERAEVPFLRGYIDESTSAAVQIKLAGIPFRRYDIILYYQGDGATHVFRAAYTKPNDSGAATWYDRFGEKITDGSHESYTWGHSLQMVPSYANNVIRIPELSGSEIIVGSLRNGGSQNRGSIAAIQIVEVGGTRLHATLESGAHPWEDVSWDDGEEWIDGATAELTVKGSPWLLIENDIDVNKFVLDGTGNFGYMLEGDTTGAQIDASALNGTVTIYTQSQSIDVNTGTHDLIYQYDGTERIIEPTLTVGGILVKRGDGTLSLGTARPTVKIEGGKLQLTATDDEIAADEIRIPVPAGYTLEGVESKVLVVTATGAPLLVTSAKIEDNKLVVRFTPPPVAEYNGTEYGRLDDALTAAQTAAQQSGTEQTINLLVNVADAHNIPEHVTVVTTSAAQLTGTVTGEGRLVCDGYLPTAASMKNALKDATHWTGTFEIRNYEHTADAHRIINLNDFANANSTVALNNVTMTAYTSGSTGSYPNQSFGWLEIMDGGWRTADGKSYSNSPLYTCGLKGTGKITMTTGGSGSVSFVGDHSGFAGEIETRTKGIVLLPAGAAQVTTATAKTITIAPNVTAQIAEGKVWVADVVKVNGTIKGSGTVDGSMQFSNTAKIDIREGLVDVDGIVSFGESIEIVSNVHEDDLAVLRADEMDHVGNIAVSVHIGEDVHTRFVVHFSDGFVKLAHDVAAQLDGAGYMTLEEAFAAANASGEDPQNIVLLDQSIAAVPAAYRNTYEIVTENETRVIRRLSTVTYAVTLNANGGLFPATEVTGAVKTKIKYVVGTEALYPFEDVVRDNYNFNGWWTTAEGENATRIKDTDIVTDNITVYARWTGATDYRVTELDGIPQSELDSRPPISIDEKWMTDYAPVDKTTQAARQEWLNTKGANGLVNWQSYVLGLNPTNANSKPFIKVDRPGDDQHGVRGELCVQVSGINTNTLGHAIVPIYHLAYATGVDAQGNLVGTVTTNGVASADTTFRLPVPARGPEAVEGDHVRYYSVGVSYQLLRSKVDPAAAATLYAHPYDGPDGEHMKDKYDVTKDYHPTNIKNGGFQEAMGALTKGVDEGWCTTDTGFEVAASSRMNTTYNKGINQPAGDNFAEVNANAVGTLYQDLSTHSRDVVEWRLKHAVRYRPDNANENSHCPTGQTMRVEIGAPKRNADETIIAATGTGSDLQVNIENGSLAVFEAYFNKTYTVKTFDGDTSTIAFGNQSTTKNLYLNRDTQNKRWYTAGGVYIVPEGQTVSRFAFISATIDADPTYGNLLNDIEFFTLLGNLVATEDVGGSVTITGYWGDTDPVNKLVVEVGGFRHEVDMQDVAESGYFTVTLPAALIGSAGSLKVYHEDYPQTAETLDLLPVSNPVHDTPIFGMLRVDSNQKETIINVPWMEASDDSVDIQICDLVRASNMTVGDELLYYTGSTGSQSSAAHTFGYKAWKLAENENGVKYWNPYTVVSGDTAGGTRVQVGAPDGTEKAIRGGALFVIRPTNHTEPIYLHGRYTPSEGTSVAAEGTDLKHVVHTLLAPPTVQQPCDLNDPACCEMTGTPAEGDRIMIPNALGALSAYHYRKDSEGNWKWGKLRAGGNFVVGAVIPIGQGAWYQSAGGSPTFTWKEKSTTSAQAGE